MGRSHAPRSQLLTSYPYRCATSVRIWSIVLLVHAPFPFFLVLRRTGPPEAATGLWRGVWAGGGEAGGHTIASRCCITVRAWTRLGAIGRALRGECEGVALSGHHRHLCSVSARPLTPHPGAYPCADHDALADLSLVPLLGCPMGVPRGGPNSAAAGARFHDPSFRLGMAPTKRVIWQRASWGSTARSLTGGHVRTCAPISRLQRPNSSEDPRCRPVVR